MPDVTACADPPPATACRVQTTLSISLRELGIPPRPAIMDAVEREAAKDEADFWALQALISADVALSAGLIKVANSALFGGRHVAVSVYDAVRKLGLQQVARTIAALSLQRVFAHVPQMERFWDSSFRTACLAAWLAQQLPGAKTVGVPDVYSYTLFRDAGIPALLCLWAPFTATCCNRPTATTSCPSPKSNTTRWTSTTPCWALNWPAPGACRPKCWPPSPTTTTLRPLRASAPGCHCAHAR